MFSKDKHVVDYYGEMKRKKQALINPRHMYYVSVDYGVVNPFSGGLYDYDPAAQTVTRIKEFYYSGRNKASSDNDPQESTPRVDNEAYYQMLCDLIRNFTRTTAKASQQRLIGVLDTAHFKVMSGAQSYTAAVKDAVNELALKQTRVAYPTGHTDSLETAVLRAVRTGVAQASGGIAIQGMIERDWDEIRVSSHLGARYGDGGQNPGNHFWWQGGLYSRTGRTKDLPKFEEATGYGTGEGLCGWNCRHSFGPGDREHNPFENFDNEENQRVYDLSQKQRSYEARIRQSKLHFHLILNFR